MGAFPSWFLIYFNARVVLLVSWHQEILSITLASLVPSECAAGGNHSRVKNHKLILLIETLEWALPLVKSNDKKDTRGPQNSPALSAPSRTVGLRAWEPHFQDSPACRTCVRCSYCEVAMTAGRQKWGRSHDLLPWQPQVSPSGRYGAVPTASRVHPSYHSCTHCQLLRQSLISWRAAL